MLTVTIDGGDEYPKIADHIGALPANILGKLHRMSEQRGPHRQYYRRAVSSFVARMFNTMSRNPWWSTPRTRTVEMPALDDMAYDCDASLGVPDAADCSQIDYSQLGAPSDRLMIGPNSPKILSSSELAMQRWISSRWLIIQDTCSFAVTSTNPVVITWDAVKTALQTIIAICVMNPLSPMAGGRAYTSLGDGVLGRGIDGMLSNRRPLQTPLFYVSPSKSS